MGHALPDGVKAMHKRLYFLAIILSLVSSNVFSATYSEFVSGDLADLRPDAQDLLLEAGQNVILGNVTYPDGSNSDHDFINMIVPTGFAITSISTTLLDGSDGIDNQSNNAVFIFRAQDRFVSPVDTFYNEGLYIDDPSADNGYFSSVGPGTYQGWFSAGSKNGGTTTWADYEVAVTVSPTAVPIPAAVWLFGSALAGLGWIRRKQTT